MKQKPLSHWTVAVTRFGEERRAAANIERQGFEYYLPEMYEYRGGRYRPTIMFEGYIMVRLQEGWRALSSTRGIARLMLTGDRPQILRADFVARLRSLEDSRGVVSFAPRLVVGDYVQVQDAGGGFAGLCGIVQGTPSHERVRVLFSMLGRSVVRDFDTRALALAS